MTEQLQLFRCNICGNIVEVVQPGCGTLVCCSVPMEHLTEEKDDNSAAEKHVPVITLEGDNKIIRVGTIPHPMEKEHYIVFIESVSADKKYLKRKFLYPGDEPKTEVKNTPDWKKFTARELCNIHGLWVSEFDEEKQ